MTRGFLKVVAISMNSTPDRAANIARARFYIEEAAELGAQWISLPEMFSYMGPYDRLLENAEDGANSALLDELADLAKRLDIVLFAGSVPERCPEDSSKVYNTLFVFDRGKGCIARYRKIHLFNLKGESAENSYNEGLAYKPGNEPVSLHLDGLHCVLAICYDLRFPELFQKLSRSTPCDILMIPSAFTEHTGQAHWHLLLRARAVDLQCFVVAANQCGESHGGRRTFGHAAIVGPWGDLLADSGSKEGIAFAELAIDALAATRSKLPVLANKKHECY